MQSLNWYCRRLRAMSPGEVASRMRSSLRDVADCCLLPLRQRKACVASPCADNGEAASVGFAVTDVKLGEWAAPEASALERAWLGRLLDRAERIAAHRLSFFDLNDHHLGDPIDWNRDHAAGKAAPRRFAPWIDYRDFDAAGDCKLVWEPSRHHHLVVLARAYRAGGDPRFAAAAVEQLQSWLDQCPYGIGMNWRSPLELGIRLINWVWTIDLIRDSNTVSEEFRRRLLASARMHVWEIARKFSGGSSANNHLIGEAAGVYVAASYWTCLDEAARWKAASREILCREILAQTHPDGGTREQAFGYHLFVLQFFVVAALVARASGDDLPEEYWLRLEKMFEFLNTMCEGGDVPPQFGDGDDGYVLDVGEGGRNVREWLAVGAALFGRSDFKASAGGWSEPARWLLGRSGREAFDAIADPQTEAIESVAFPETGYCLLQSGRRGSDDRLSVLFDCGELGMGPLAGHGHADALSFTLRAFGVDVLVDPGTYDYFTHPPWRSYFRGTRAHNTVEVDGKNQSEMLGSFLWGARAVTRRLEWAPSADGGVAAGEHDGYARLDDPVVHRRRLDLSASRRVLEVRDEIIADGQHDVAVFLHLTEHCRVSAGEGGRFDVETGAGTIVIQFDAQLNVEGSTGSTDPPAGWVSRGYHRKAEATTLVGRCRTAGPASLLTRIEIGQPGAR
ncbi:MAG TPA: alginate lyase family protein [Phycisphaerae bacterium]|nr:alginate lyase family protein [Phycisphaerae bacterium]